MFLEEGRSFPDVSISTVVHSQRISKQRVLGGLCYFSGARGCYFSGLACSVQLHQTVQMPLMPSAERCPSHSVRKSCERLPHGNLAGSDRRGASSSLSVGALRVLLNVMALRMRCPGESVHGFCSFL